MAFVFVIPGALQAQAGGRSEIRIDGHAATVNAALSLLWRECPGLRDRVLTEQHEIRPHVNVFVDGTNARHSGLASPVRDNAEIIIVPAVSGG
jgi:molybdopterin converting factor small subunit